MHINSLGAWIVLCHACRLHHCWLTITSFRWPLWVHKMILHARNFNYKHSKELQISGTIVTQKQSGSSLQQPSPASADLFGVLQVKRCQNNCSFQLFRSHTRPIQLLHYINQVLMSPVIYLSFDLETNKSFLTGKHRTDFHSFRVCCRKSWLAFISLNLRASFTGLFLGWLVFGTLLSVLMNRAEAAPLSAPQSPETFWDSVAFQQLRATRLWITLFHLSQWIEWEKPSTGASVWINDSEQCESNRTPETKLMVRCR